MRITERALRAIIRQKCQEKAVLPLEIWAILVGLKFLRMTCQKEAG